MSGKSVSRKSVRPPLVSSLVSRSLDPPLVNRSLLASQECETETEAQAGLEEIVCVCV